MGAPIVAFALLSLILCGGVVLLGAGALAWLVVHCERRQMRSPYLAAGVGGVCGPLVALYVLAAHPFTAAIAIPWGAAAAGWAAIPIMKLSSWIAAKLAASGDASASLRR